METSTVKRILLEIQNEENITEDTSVKTETEGETQKPMSVPQEIRNLQIP